MAKPVVVISKNLGLYKKIPAYWAGIFLILF